MSKSINDGGHAFPHVPVFCPSGDLMTGGTPGMSMREWYAGVLQIDDRLVKVVRAMDDRALVVFGASVEFFAKFPDSERDEHIAEATPDWPHLTEVEKIQARLELEARAIARVRFMQADAMIAESMRRPE